MHLVRRLLLRRARRVDPRLSCARGRAALGLTDERARLFVGLELPAAVREALVGWRAPVLSALPALRPVAAEALHVTLCFLGGQAVAEIEQIAAACRPVAELPEPELSIGEPAWLPRRQPRVLAIRLADAGGRLGAVQAWLSGALEAGRWYAPEQRPFLAHVTVARVGRGAGLGGRGAGPGGRGAGPGGRGAGPGGRGAGPGGRGAGPGGRGGRIRSHELPPAPELRFAASSVTLFRSRLGHEGAHYERLSEIRLSG